MEPRAMHRIAVNPVDAQESNRITVHLLGIYGVLAGLVGVFDDLTFSPAYSAAVSVPGGLIPWSIAVTTNSVVLLLMAIMSRKRTLALTLMVGAVWTLAMAIGFVIAYLNDTEMVSIFAAISLGLISVMHSQKAWLIWSSRKIHMVMATDVRCFEKFIDCVENEEE